jgi:hypothetical protein
MRNLDGWKGWPPPDRLRILYIRITKLFIVYYLCMSHACASFPTYHHFAHLCIRCLPCFALLLASLCHLPFIVTFLLRYISYLFHHFPFIVTYLLRYISYLFHHFPFIVTYLLCYISYLFHHFPSIVTYLRQPPKLLICLHYLLAIANTYFITYLLSRHCFSLATYCLFVLLFAYFVLMFVLNLPSLDIIPLPSPNLMPLWEHEIAKLQATSSPS